MQCRRIEEWGSALKTLRYCARVNLQGQLRVPSRLGIEAPRCPASSLGRTFDKATSATESHPAQLASPPGTKLGPCCPSPGSSQGPGRFCAAAQRKLQKLRDRSSKALLDASGGLEPEAAGHCVCYEAPSTLWGR